MPPHDQFEVIESDVIQEWAEDCISKLRKHAERKPEGDAAQRFAAALSNVKRVTVSDLKDRAFYLSSGTLTLNAVPLQKTFEIILQEVSSESIELDPSEFMPLCKMVVAIFLLHEMRHIDQGVERYEDIQTLKELGFSPLIAKFDLLADRDALVAFSQIFSDTFDGDELLAFKTGLAFSPRYFFRAFDFDPLTKPHKTLRAVSLILMLARIFQSQEPDRTPKVCLTAALSFYGLETLDELEERPFVIVAEQPSRRLYAIADLEWRSALATIIRAVEAKDYDSALGYAMAIVKAKEFSC